ncbi:MULTISPECIES: Mut7-C RNAse domain-containing protein [Microbulbifer]|uniref:Mut7-C RNAse domain-containing protein n=1 Tax=Microbulbifer TaxID=48073 RepID=UPI000A92CD2E|nr:MULTISPECIES: Mut7-C RNAse domain-containing protein [Microbulbifer]
MSGQATTITVTFRFYRELNDFLPRDQRQRDLVRRYPCAGSIKDAIENLGVPHTEIDLILINGESVDFNYQIDNGDRVSVYPMFESLDIAPLNRLRPKPLRNPRFVLDCHLGRLARYLRLLGFDTLLPEDSDDAALVRVSVEQQRTLLSRDRALFRRRALQRGYWVRATNPRLQVAEVAARFQLQNTLRPFSRCTRCNGTLRSVPKEKVLHQLRENTRQHFHHFWQCAQCGQVYWRGSHYDRMSALIGKLVLAPAGEK